MVIFCVPAATAHEWLFHTRRPASAAPIFVSAARVSFIDCRIYVASGWPIFRPATDRPPSHSCPAAPAPPHDADTSLRFNWRTSGAREAQSWHWEFTWRGMGYTKNGKAFNGVVCHAHWESPKVVNLLGMWANHILASNVALYTAAGSFDPIILMEISTWIYLVYKNKQFILHTLCARYFKISVNFNTRVVLNWGKEEGCYYLKHIYVCYFPFAAAVRCRKVMLKNEIHSLPSSIQVDLFILSKDHVSL